MERLIALCGLVLMLGIVYLLSSSKQNISWKTVFSGLALQFLFGLFILKTPFGLYLFEGARAAFDRLLNFTQEGSDFIFGSLADSEQVGFVFLSMVLPTIIFMSALMSVLYHLGLMQILIRFTAKIMVKVMGTSGAESMATAANIFAGQTEAPLVIRPFIGKMTRSELMALMTGGMATVAGGVMVAYIGLGIDAGHLLAASVMSAPAALVCAKILIPETERSLTHGEINVELPRTTTNLIDAAAFGAGEGLKLALNVGAMLLAFIALIALVNGVLMGLGGLVGFDALNLELIFGYLFAPLAFMLGVPWSDILIVGNLLAQKLVLNEFVAYLGLTAYWDDLSERSIVIATYALCGFANFSSIAIQVGGIGALAPERRKDLAQLGIPALIGGTVACMMTAAIAGILI